ncbi:hypothetical protein, conserved [Eimeria praecox]|uniref:Transmembrane protein n=1 Tax=Eimeria praecox TaxID=51316 RepID=U6H0H3_9EIME|nr:hypothetical protein, conserved [Eimeria praecox]
MFGISLRKALLFCAASAVLACSWHKCSAATAGETALPSRIQNGAQGQRSVAAAAEKPQEYVPGPSGFLEGKNPASQVAALNSGRHVESPAVLGSPGGQVEATQSPFSSDNPNSFTQLQHSGAAPAASPTEKEQRNVQADSRRRLEGPLSKMMDSLKLLSQHTSGGISPPRRLQLLAGISQLTQLPQLSTLPNLLGGGLSARDKDQLETFSRRVATSRERLYKDLLFTTGAKQHGLDEFAMKQLVAKVGLENLSSGNAPSSSQLSHQEFRVLDAARRSHFSVERIIAAYEREVAQHARTLRNALETNMNNPSIRAKVSSIASENLFKRPRDVSVRRLQDSSPNRNLAALLQGTGLLGTAGSLIRSMDPLSLSQSLSAGLGGLGLQHLHLPNIGGLGLRQDSTSQTMLPITDLGGLQQALQSVFPLPQQVTALSGPLRSFQQGVETATDGAIGAFLSREGLLPFLSVDKAKELLGGLIGGVAIGPNGLKGWQDLELSPVSVNGLAAVMPFDTFLNKFAALAHEVDSDVGVMKREARKRLGAGGVSILPDQLSEVDSILDRLVLGTLRAPVRRLQQTERTEVGSDLPSQLQVLDQHVAPGSPPFPQKPSPILQRPTMPTQQALGPPMEPAHPPQQTPLSGQAVKPDLAFPSHQPVPTLERPTPKPEQAPKPEQVAPKPEQVAPKPEQVAPKPEQVAPKPEQPTPKPEQPTPKPEQPTPKPEQPTPKPEQPTPKPEQPTPRPEQPIPKPELPAPEDNVPAGQAPEDSEQQQGQQEDNSAALDSLLGSLLGDEPEVLDSEEEMNAALQRVELLADAVTVLLKEYEKAVEHLQDLLDDQLDAAEEIREELEDQVREMKDQVRTSLKPKQQGAAAAAAEVARAYDEAMEGFKASLEALLEEPQINQPVSPAMQEDLAALAARIQGTAEEKLPSLATVH